MFDSCGIKMTRYMQHPQGKLLWSKKGFCLPIKKKKKKY